MERMDIEDFKACSILEMNADIWELLEQNHQVWNFVERNIEDRVWIGFVIIKSDEIL